MPDVNSHGFDRSNCIAARGKVLGRAVGGELALHVRLEIRHQGLRLDANQHTARVQPLEEERPQNSACRPSGQFSKPSSGILLLLRWFEIFDNQSVEVTRSKVPSASHCLRRVDNLRPVRFKPGKALVEGIDVVDRVYTAEFVEGVSLSAENQNTADFLPPLHSSRQYVSARSHWTP